MWLWGIKVATYAFTTTNSEASTFDMLLDYKCTLSISKSDENYIWMGTIDGTSSSTPLTNSIKQHSSFSTIEHIKPKLEQQIHETLRHCNIKKTFQTPKNWKHKMIEDLTCCWFLEQ